MNTDTMSLLAASTEESVVALYQRFLAGEFTEDVFVELALAALAAAGARGAALADAAVAAELSVQRQKAVPAVGLASDDLDREVLALLLKEALRTPKRSPDLDEDDEDDDPTEGVIRVIVRSNVMDQTQKATGRAMKDQGVKRWTRVLNGGACPLCHDLAGDVLPTSAEMYTHKGCGCSQKPVDQENKA